ncbi:unnamed protein product [Rotaria sordida]|uniref:F-box domain-containing protein n=2 Tax=Rotaria sordida TaxID=392033 RepID=A0A814A3G0_9BILA|nr:unnamed protein product [Rotaria sordida]
MQQQIFLFIAFYTVQIMNFLISEPDEIRRLRRNSIENASHYSVLDKDQYDATSTSIDPNNLVDCQGGGRKSSSSSSSSRGWRNRPYRGVSTCTGAACLNQDVIASCKLIGVILVIIAIIFFYHWWKHQSIQSNEIYMPITSIENLSNELFHEIFDYLDGSEIYQAFSNLNYRFQQFLNYSSFPLKIRINSSSYKSYMNTYQQILFNNKHRIISLHLFLPLQSNEFFSSYSIDSSFNCLESLLLFKIPPSILLSLLINLTCLPRLFSLTIDTQRTLDDLTEVYRLIFLLPKLKYMKCSARRTVVYMSLPIAKKEQLTNIEYLVINHSCTFNQVSTIISYTPELYHLNLMKSYDNYFNNEILLPMDLFRLTYLSIKMCDIMLDELELFIAETGCNLKVLRIITHSHERDYLDADQWQELIEDYLPDLEEFYLQYHEKVDPEAAMSDTLPSDNFRSLFWIERQWLMDVEMNSLKIVCSIGSYRKRWYDMNSSIEISKSTRLTVWNVPDVDYRGLLKLTIGEILTITQIYHLEIFQRNICSNELIELIDKLSALDSLKIYSLGLLESIFADFYEHELDLVANKNNISKVYFVKMDDIEEVYFLIRLCPRMTYLKINLIDNVDYEIFLKDLLMKINNDCNQYLRSLCLYIPTANNDMINKLQDMINREKLLHYFTIKLEFDNIYLQWK